MREHADHLPLSDNPYGVNDAGNVTELCQNDIDLELTTDSDLQEHPYRR
jgi:hypothetical protein